MDRIKPLKKLKHTLSGNFSGLINFHNNISGICSPKLYGNCSRLIGDCTGLFGDCSGLFGNCTEIIGNCTWLHGNCTRVKGNLSDIPIGQRKEFPLLDYWIGN